MKRITVNLLCLLCALGVLPERTARAAAAARPNVVVILADDQGWGDLSVNGNSNLSTPNIDSLANPVADRVRRTRTKCDRCHVSRRPFIGGHDAPLPSKDQEGKVAEVYPPRLPRCDGVSSSEQACGELAAVHRGARIVGA